MLDASISHSLRPRRPRLMRHLALPATMLSVLTLPALTACGDDATVPTQPEALNPAAQQADANLQAASNSWASKATMLTARSGLVTATTGRVIYAVGGSASGNALPTVEAYDAMTNKWTPKAPLPEARRNGSGAAMIKGKLYVPGGFDSTGTPTKTLFVYTRSTNRWSKKADLPAPSVAGISAVIHGQLYVLTPVVSSGGGPRLDRYDPATDSWTPLAAPPRRHSLGAGGVINGKLYVAGGDEGRFLLRTLDVFDPATNTWSTKADLPTARTAVGGGVLKGKLYVVGGSPTQARLSSLATVEVYDPKTDKWATKASMLTARLGLAASAASGRFFAIGGEPGNGAAVLASNQAYTP